MDEEYWLALARAPKLSTINFIRLIKYFGSPRAVFEAYPWQWQAINMKMELQNYLQKPNWQAVENDMRWLAQPGNYLLTLHHPYYPQQLREIYDPPPLLFIQGDCNILKNLQLAIIGTRHASLEGKQIAWTFAKDLSYYGFTIISGMGLGIDGASHYGALAGSGKTIAIIGRGLEQIYPPQQKKLAQRIVETGALISEFLPDTPVKGYNFLSSNRIISGLSLGTLLVEAPIYSRALHIIRFAAEQGREVFAIPGTIHNPLAKGCNFVIKQGAKLTETVEDIISEFKIYLGATPKG